jgi:membrane protease YdiL (CAAX protease family)
MVIMPGDIENLSTEAGGGPAESLPPQPPQLPLAPREIWTLRDLLLFLGFIPFAFLASDLLALIGYVALRPFVGWHQSAELVQKNTFFLLNMQCLFYILVLGFLFLASKVKHNQPFWKSLGCRRPTGKEVAGWLAGGCGLAVLAGLALAIQPDTRAFPLEGMFNSRAASFAIGAFAIAIAPLVEEVVFRGLLFAICEREVGMRIAVVITAALFAGLHIPEYWPAWNHILIIFVVGMVFSLARGMTGSLTPSVILHIGYNSLMMTGLFFSTQHFRTAQGIFALW